MNRPLSKLSKLLKWLWRLALLVAVVNALVVAQRLPNQKRLAADADEQAVQDAVRWIAPLPADMRLLLLVHSEDQTNFHFSARLIYYIYPHRIDIASNTLPPDAPQRYDGILAFGRMTSVLEVQQHILADTWRMAGQNPRASLAISNRIANTAPQTTHSPELPVTVRAVFGIFSLLVVIVLGALLMALTLRAPPFAFWWANLAVAHLVGAAAFAIVQMACILAVGKPLVWPVYALVCLLLAGGFAWQERRRELLRWMAFRRISEGGHNKLCPYAAGYPAKEFTPLLPLSLPHNVWRERLCHAALVIGIFTVLERAWLIGLDWDALTIWQLKAKMLFLDDNLAVWRDTSQFPYAHFDYPLLAPLLTWWNYRHFSGVDLHWAQANGFLFYADLLAIFAASACRYVPAAYALLATALLSGLPEVTLHAVSGYADLPLSAYFLGAGVFLTRALTEREDTAWPLVGGMLAGVILVKNEGLLACASALIAAFVYFKRLKLKTQRSTLNAQRSVLNPQPSTLNLSWWLLAPVVAYLPWWILKNHWQLTNDVIQPAHPPHLTISLLWWRMWYAIIYGFGKQWLWLGPWFPAWGLLGIAVLAGGAVAVKRGSASARPLWLLAGIQFCGYLGIYIITPSALPAHIISSVDRLVLHIAPLLLLAALLDCFSEEKGERRKEKEDALPG